jgi:nucleotide-binding universal stress UspA family protein
MPLLRVQRCLSAALKTLFVGSVNQKVLTKATVPVTVTH